MEPGSYISQDSLYEYSYKELRACEGAKQIELDSSTLWYIDKNNTLYGCGYKVVFNANTDSNIENAIKISDNVKQVKCYGNSILYITQNNQIISEENNNGIIPVFGIEYQNIVLQIKIIFKM